MRLMPLLTDPERKFAHSIHHRIIIRCSLLQRLAACPVGLTGPAIIYFTGAVAADFIGAGGVELEPATCFSIWTISWASPEYSCG